MTTIQERGATTERVLCAIDRRYRHLDTQLKQALMSELALPGLEPQALYSVTLTDGRVAVMPAYQPDWSTRAFDLVRVPATTRELTERVVAALYRSGDLECVEVKHLAGGAWSGNGYPTSQLLYLCGVPQVHVNLRNNQVLNEEDGATKWAHPHRIQYQGTMKSVIVSTSEIRDDHR